MLFRSRQRGRRGQDHRREEQLADGLDDEDHRQEPPRGQVAVADPGGQEIQFNVVNAATLKDAQANPENYKDLIIRVAGYSARFIELARDLQNDIIARTEHEGI